MTTLPTRDDGGIDWNRILFNDAGFFFWGDGAGGSVEADPFEFGRLVERHTIERCERVVEGLNLVDDDPVSAIRKLGEAK